MSNPKFAGRSLVVMWFAFIFALAGCFVIAGCAGGSSTGKDGGGSGEMSGEITVITHRTDIVDTLYQEYARAFNEIYPDVTVKFESMTDYAGQIKIRMNTEDYGDVLHIPADIPPQELGEFFEPLGEMDELAEKYLFVDEAAYNNVTYGIPITINADGILYNKKVFEEAGIDELPTTPDEFLQAMHRIKENTDAIPYYTNYASGWALDQWEGHRLSVSGNPDYVNIVMVHSDDVFAPGTPHYIIYKLMYDLAAQGLIEDDPTTTDWENSKPMLASGEIGAMVLGSWAIVQFQEFADDPDTIGYMPFPYQVDGKVYAASGGDYKIGINKHSKNKAAARAWLDFFVDESGFALSQGGISPLKGAQFPETLQAFQELGVEFISNTPAREGEEGLLELIDQEAEIGFYQPDFKQRIIEAAIGNRNESFDDIMDDLNTRWNEARARVVP